MAKQPTPNRTTRRAEPAGRGARLSQVKDTFRMARENDPRLLVWLALAFVLPFGALLGVGFGIGHPLWWGVLGFLFGVMLMMIVFGRRATTAAYASVEGQLGAGAAVLQAMRGKWTVEPGVTANANQDLVHRVLGRPGVILVGEGSPARLPAMLAAEKRKVGRVVADVPIYDFIVGDGEGQVPLRKLQNTVSKLPRNLKPGMVSAVDQRLKALRGGRMPLPKGPLPKGARMPKPKRQG